jgi:hypothetical protein
MNKPSRRAVVRTGVWAVPVVATAAAAPAFAGTGDTPPVTIDGIGAACKLPGEGQHSKDYRFTLSFDSNSANAETVTINSFDFKGSTYTPSPNQVVVPANASNFMSSFTLFGFNNSSNTSAVVTYSVNGVVGTATVSFPSFHPCPDH